jgi:hypothetical protein
MVDKIEIKTVKFGEDGFGTKIVEGEKYRTHWFIHEDENGNHSLTHVNSGQRLNSFDSSETCKQFCDVIIDDVGIDGSFQTKEDVPKYQRMIVRQLVENLDLLKLEDFAIISSISHTH